MKIWPFLNYVGESKFQNMSLMDPDVEIWIFFLRFGSAMIFSSGMGYHPILDARFAPFSSSSFKKKVTNFFWFFFAPTESKKILNIYLKYCNKKYNITSIFSISPTICALMRKFAPSLRSWAKHSHLCTKIYYSHVSKLDPWLLSGSKLLLTLWTKSEIVKMLVIKYY